MQRLFESQNELVASAVGIGRGGLAVALAKSAVAGQTGANVILQKIPGQAHATDSILFSESQGRILVSVRSDEETQFKKIIHSVPHARIGEVGGCSLSIGLSKSNIDIPLQTLTNAYRKFFKDW